MRLFVGLELPPAVRESLAGLAHGLQGARWITPENLHVSLRFIGEVDHGEAEDIDLALAAVRAPAFAMTLSGVGTFGSGAKVRALWAGVEAQPSLMHLQDKIESALVRTGLPPEPRKFKPHVTLARFRSRPGPGLHDYLSGHALFRAGPIEVDGFLLIRSHLSKNGSIYEPLRTYPLSAVQPA
jgi:2'-5' RNA ligase